MNVDNRERYGQNNLFKDIKLEIKNNKRCWVKDNKIISDIDYINNNKLDKNDLYYCFMYLSFIDDKYINEILNTPLPKTRLFRYVDDHHYEIYCKLNTYEDLFNNIGSSERKIKINDRYIKCCYNKVHFVLHIIDNDIYFDYYNLK